ncbi:MAG: hypothetical protein D6785_01350, partial [Planctomycetota bacterium]
MRGEIFGITIVFKMRGGRYYWSLDRKKRRTLWMCMALCLCMGCGPVGIALGIFEASKKQSSSTVDTPPGVIEGAVTGGGSADSTPIEITYKLVDKESSPVSITVEWKDDLKGITDWQKCAEGAGSDGTINLSSSPSGVSHKFIWDYTQDYPLSTVPSSTSVQIRITPSNNVPVIIKNIRVGNTAPVVQVFLSGTQSGNIVVNYLITDAENDTAEIEAEFYGPDPSDTTPDGSTPKGWWKATTSGGNGNAGPDPNMRNGISASSTGIAQNYIWDSVIDGAGRTSMSGYKFRIRARDFSWANWGSWGETQNTFTVDNGNSLNTLPTAEIVAIGEAVKNQKLKIIYRLKDNESDTCSIRIEWSNNGGVSYIPCQDAQNSGSSGNYIANGDGTTSLSSSPSGNLHSIVWDLPQEQFLQGNQWITLRILPRDSYGENPVEDLNKKNFFLHHWSFPVNVSNTTGFSGTPRLAVDNTGKVHLVW